MESVRIRASPKQLSKLRNGHKVSIKPAMEGEGLMLVIDPSQYNQISRTFSKGKGKMVQLSPEEIMANREIGGEGIFSTLKKVGKTVMKNPIAKSLAKTAIDTAVQSAGASGYVPPSVAKALGKEAKSQVDGYGIWTGGGDHSGGFGGMGLYAGRRTYGGGMGGGALLNVSNSHLPPALQSQNLSANFAFRNQLPPALAQMK